MAMLGSRCGQIMAAVSARRPLRPLRLPVLPVLPVLLGARVYVELSESPFRRTVLVLLTVSGLAKLASSVPRLLPR